MGTLAPDSCVAVTKAEHIFAAYRGTPVEELLTYHNLGLPFDQNSVGKLLIGTCMDRRIQLRIPAGFSYVLRTGGANLRGLEFHISLEVANGVSTLCLIGHDDCAMAGGVERGRDTFVRGLTEFGGLSEGDAGKQYDEDVARCHVGDPLTFVRSETTRLSQMYPGALVAPLFYSVTEHTLYQVDTG